MNAFPAVLALGLLFPPSPASAGAAKETTGRSAEMEYLRGMLLERRGAYSEALEAYEKALSLDPRSGYIAREAAELSLEMGANDKALELAAQAVAIDPKSAEARVLLGKVRWATGDAAAAEDAFQEALARDPHSSESIFALSSLLAAREPAKAKGLLQRFLEQNPDHAAEAHFNIAKIDLQGGDVRSAREHLRGAIALDPGSDSASSRWALAQTYEIERATEAALAEYLELRSVEPHNAALLGRIGALYALMGRQDEARTHYEAAKAVDPADPAANAWLSLEAEREGDFARAAEHLGASAALAEDPTLSLRLSFDLISAGRLKEAVLALEKAHARWPNNDQVAYFLALGYDDVKDGPRAISLLRRVVGLKPDSRDARYELAVLLEKYGDMPASEAEFRLFLADRPDDASAWNYLGFSLADRGLKLAEAEEMIRRAVALDPKNGAYLDSLGWVHFKQGRSTEAAAELARALALSPDDAEVWEHLGDASAAAGDRPAAWRAWQRAAALDPSDEDSRRKAQKLEAAFTPEQAGGYHLEHLAALQGGVKKLSGLCEIKGDILGHGFGFSGVFTFRAPDDLDVDLLGPVFTPLFRIRLNKQGFVMDPFQVEGVRPESVMESASAAFSAIRDYYSGRLFASRPARLQKGWRGRRDILIPGWKIALSPDGLWAVGLSPEAAPGLLVSLEELTVYQGRRIPRTIAVSGKGFSLTLRFENVNVELGAGAAAQDEGEAAP